MESVGEEMKLGGGDKEWGGDGNGGGVRRGAEQTSLTAFQPSKTKLVRNSSFSHQNGMDKTGT